MEKYEINKFIEEYDLKLNDLKIAFNLDGKRPVLKELEKKISESDFWSDQETAKKIINESNALKEIIVGYDTIYKQYEDVKEFTEMALAEEEAMLLFESMVQEVKENVAKLEETALLSGKYDFSNCILELHPGAGGTESMDWADMLYRMYTRFCALKGFKVNVLDYLPGDEAGIKSITLSISGPYAYGLLKAERGVHRLVRISPFDSNARRHTSFVSCISTN